MLSCVMRADQPRASNRRAPFLHPPYGVFDALFFITITGSSHLYQIQALTLGLVGTGSGAVRSTVFLSSRLGETQSGI